MCKLGLVLACEDMLHCATLFITPRAFLQPRAFSQRQAVNLQAGPRLCSSQVSIAACLPAAVSALNGYLFLQKDTADTMSKTKAPLADIRRYLKATGLIELRHIRKLSSLCAQTYYIKKLTVRLQGFALLEACVYVFGSILFLGSYACTLVL